jgi:hypothetical protein
MSPLNQFFDNGLGRHDHAERAPIGGEFLTFDTEEPTTERYELYAVYAGVQ